MSGQHTPGPWDCEGGHGNQSLCLTDAGGMVLGNVRAFILSGEIRHGSPVQMRWEEGFANARLIAAAPDLVFQLLAAANYIDALGGDSKSYRAAIAAAAGGAS